MQGLKTITAIAIAPARLGQVASLFLISLAPNPTDAGEIRAKSLLETPNTHLGQPLRLPAKDPHVAVLTVTVPPGEATPWHTHAALVVGYIVRGEITVEYATGETTVLGTGEALVEAVDTVHRGVNHGKAPVEILVVHVGEGNAPLSVPAAAPAPGPKRSPAPRVFAPD